MMQSRSFFQGHIPEDCPPVEIPYAGEKLDLVTPVMETFWREWKNSEYAKKYGFPSGIEVERRG
jgi:hypothetical protein